MATKHSFSRATYNATNAVRERAAQQLDYEWIAVKHSKKMFLRSLKKQAECLNCLTRNLINK